MVYPHHIIDVARKLRQMQTPTEKLLWERLRNRKLDGLKFSRQHPFGRFVADFYCAELKLIIECEGDIHKQKDQKEYDGIRFDELKTRGLYVMRIQNEEVEKNVDGVLRKIREFRKSNTTKKRGKS